MHVAPTTAPDIRRQFRDAGFDVVEASGNRPSVEVRKHHCARLLEHNPKGKWVPSGPPQFVVRGLKCKLEDRGYQKFWHSSGQRFPVRVADLQTLHRFDEEVRAILGVRSLYHESLGTTSAQSRYDRLTGRTDR